MLLLLLVTSDGSAVELRPRFSARSWSKQCF
jgi:hypothetical protein